MLPRTGPSGGLLRTGQRNFRFRERRRISGGLYKFIVPQYALGTEKNLEKPKQDHLIHYEHVMSFGESQTTDYEPIV